MKIWLVQVGEPLPTDSGSPKLLRFGFLADYLAKQGHDVIWWTSTFDHYLRRQRAETDVVVQSSGYRIRMLHSSGYTTNVSLMRLLEHAGVARRFRTLSLFEEKPDIVLCGFPTPDLAREAVRYATKVGVPVLVDIHDLWPDAIVDRLPRWIRWASPLLFRRMVRHTRWCLSTCDGILSISPGYFDWGLRQAGRVRGPFDKVLPLGCRAPIPTAESIETKMLSLGIGKDSRICGYVGSFGRTYDLAPILQAARQSSEIQRRNVQFVFSGEGELGQRWRDMAKGLTNVVFTGWIGAAEVDWLRARTWIGLQPYVEHAPQGLANKLCDYLGAGIPLLSSLGGENEALLLRHGCGVTYRAGDVLDFTDKLLRLLDDDGERNAMARRARELFDAEFDSAKIVVCLEAHLDLVVRSRERTHM